MLGGEEASEWRQLGVPRQSRKNSWDTAWVGQRLYHSWIHGRSIQKPLLLYPQRGLTYLFTKRKLLSKTKNRLLASQTSTFVHIHRYPALGSENLWLISEILFLFYSIKLVCLCGEAIGWSNSFEKRKCNLSGRLFLFLMPHGQVEWFL